MAAWPALPSGSFWRLVTFASWPSTASRRSTQELPTQRHDQDGRNCCSYQQQLYWALSLKQQPRPSDAELLCPPAALAFQTVLSHSSYHRSGVCAYARLNLYKPVSRSLQESK
eukprot:jgi/Astpho2/7216/Aster-01529